MAHPKRPRRQRKADRLISPGSSGEEIQCDYAMAPMDRLATDMDRKWGIEQLPALVSPETALKYGKAIAHLNQCIQDCDPAKCAAAAANCIKGLNAMDAEATAAGHKPAAGATWEYEIPATESAEPFRFAILADDAEWQTAKEKRPDLIFFTMREVAMALQLKLASPLVVETKKRFPGATVTRIKPADPVNWAAGGDEIPDF